MSRTIALNEFRDDLESLEYPIDRSAVRAEYADATVEYADGSEPLADVFDRIEDERFDSADDLTMAVYNTLPIEAVGEPGQSEGDA